MYIGCNCYVVTSKFQRAHTLKKTTYMRKYNDVIYGWVKIQNRLKKAYVLPVSLIVWFLFWVEDWTVSWVSHDKRGGEEPIDEGGGVGGAHVGSGPVEGTRGTILGITSLGGKTMGLISIDEPLIELFDIVADENTEVEVVGMEEVLGIEFTQFDFFFR